MNLDKDFRDLLFVFNENGVRYLVIGGFAYGFHAEPRGTKDFDIWISSDEANAQAVFRALAEYGAPIAEMSPADFSDRKSFLQIGLPPNRVDIMQAIAGVEFEEAWSRRAQGQAPDGLRYTVISLQDLIQNKSAVGRPQDKVDVRRLKKLIKPNKGKRD